MKHILLILFITIMSCKKTETNNIENKAIQETKTTNTYTDWDKLEIDVTNTIDSILKSDSNNRKRLLIKFISFADKVDGAIAEGYCNFAFEYVEHNTKDYFSVLTKNDTVLIDKWAETSANEILLIAENTNDIESIWNDISKNHFKNRNDLKTYEIELDKIYLSKVKEAINKK